MKFIKQMKDLNAFDFGDLIYFRKLFEDHKDIRNIYQNNFKHILQMSFRMSIANG